MRDTVYAIGGNEQSALLMGLPEPSQEGHDAEYPLAAEREGAPQVSFPPVEPAKID